MNKLGKKIISLFMCALMVLSCLNVSVFTELGTMIAKAATTTLSAGDINGDGTVNNNDLTRLLKYLSGESVYVVEQLLDTNGDGAVNGKDLTRLMKYISGESVEIYPLGCIHSLIKNEKVDATCTKSGNIEYWQCNLCNRLFTDNGGTQETTLSKTVINAKGHTEEIIPAVAPSGSQYGYTEGVKCFCGVIIVEPEPIPPLVVGDEIYVEYDLRGNLASDIYLKNQIAKLVANGENIHANESVIDTTKSTYYLKSIPSDTIPGYNFKGWYDGTGDDAKRITSIAKGQTGYLELFARWELAKYKITFSSEFITVPEINNHTVNKSTALPGADVMNLPGYRWLGWSDENGNLYTSVYPEGKTGDVMLHANWQSYRNQAVPVEKLAEPKIYIDEDAKTYMFTFKLGEIRNVPLYTICDFGKMIPGQPVVREEVTTTNTIAKSEAKELASIVAQATTKTSSWSLTNKWNKISSVSESHCAELGIDIEEIDYDFASDTSKLALGGSYGESESETVNYGVNAKIYGKSTKEVSFPTKVLNAGVKNEIGGEIGGHYDNTTVNESYWNNSISFENSFTTENSKTTSEKLSQHIKDEYNLSTTIDIGSDQTVTEGCETSTSETNEYTSSLAYTQEEIKTTSYITEYTTDTEGWWRQVKVGTIGVIGVVAYDIETSTYSVYTYNVLDGTSFQNYMDFSMESGAYNDHENGVIPFEVPISVNEYISNSLGYTTDLKIDRETGIIDTYKGNSEHIHIPDYWTVNNGDGTYTAIKVTGIKEGAFANKTNIKSVRLSKYITEIPDNAFSGCTSLETVEYDKLTSIGDRAFENCTSLKTFTVDTNIEILGSDAFKNAPKVIVNAKNTDVLKAAVSGGIKNIEVYLKDLEDKLENTTLTVPSLTEKFAIYGMDKYKNPQSFTNVRIESVANETIINGMKFVGNMSTPLELSSSKVTLAFVEVESSPGLAMILKADTTNLYLQDKINLKSNGNVTVLTKNITINEVSGSNTTTTLSVFDGMLLYCGTFTDIDELFLGTKVNISKESYDQYFADSIPWVVESEVPTGATVIETKWTYDKREYETSTDPSFEEGWTLYDTQITSYGNKIGPVYSDPSNGVRKVTSEKYVTSSNYKTVYVYYHYHKDGSHDPVSWTKSSVYKNYAEFIVEKTLEKAGTASNGDPYYKYWHSSSNWWVVYFKETRQQKVSDNYGTRWYYQDPIYTYYFYRDLSEESNENPTGQTNVYNVVKLVRYISE